MRGNEIADSIAKSAVDLTPTTDNFRTLYTDLKPQINKLTQAKWQRHYNDNIHNKLSQIQSTLGDLRRAFRKSRREQVIISGLRMGHTKLTHFFILKQGQQTHCLICQTLCNVKQILIECRALAIIKKGSFKPNTLTNLLENVKKLALSFFRETGMYQNYDELKSLCKQMRSCLSTKY